jgi:acyl-[acyl-carrier-protein]-phospholipid O-acyltransferase / long-chain-fatty-acid--[acyl-carrier-protein] ligase
LSIAPVASDVKSYAVTGLRPAQRAIYFIGLLLGRAIYRVSRFGHDHLPAGGFLLLPNHISFVDAIILQLACPHRQIRYIIDESFYRKPLLHPILKLAGCIPITSRRAKEGLRTAADAIRAGDIVCLFPEGQLTRSGTLLRLQRGYELVARQAEAPVVPVWLDQLWGSVFSYKGGGLFRTRPRIPFHVSVAFGKPLATERADIATVREELLKLGEFCFSRRPSLNGHLAAMALRGLKRRPFAKLVIDGLDDTDLSAAKLLGAAAVLSRYLRRNFPNEERIAIVLPASKGAVVANLAVALADKVPVGLNFTSGRAAVESCCRRANLRVVITASAVIKRLPDFPWPEEIVKMDALLPSLKRSILAWWIASVVVPAPLLLRWLKVPRQGGHREAVLLFTSGSSGEPKGVVLSHRNLLGNVAQFNVLLDATREDAILASLPFFHSFGCTVTLWYPLVEGVRVVTSPNPLEAGKNAALIDRYKLTLLVAAPTFLRGYLRKAERHQLRSLRLIITGAEKLPVDLAELFEQKFGKHVFEGYGLTETAPVVSVNLPEPKPNVPGGAVQPSSRLGSVGKMAPGIAAEIRDPDSEAKLSLHDTGMLWLRGPNIFEGYLHEPERTAEVFRDGWFKTGDIARFDEDGFLYIEGRLSRFSKIGGEMVPHEALEQKINAVLGFNGESERSIAIVGVGDDLKGEATLLLCVTDIDLTDLREKLRAGGVPNLWIPKKVCRVEAIPVLASGKLDLTRCKRVAEECAAND